MDRRYEARLPTDLPVCVVQLQNGTQTTGTLVDISDKGICALLPGSLLPGTLVQVSVVQVGLYGEIVYSNPETTGYRTGIFVEPVLLEKSNVARIVEGYLHASLSRVDTAIDSAGPAH